MAKERFPLRTVLRRIDVLEQQLAWWENFYLEQGGRSLNAWNIDMYTARAQILHDMQPKLRDLFRQLERLPRLS
jgi:hypothetical protein